MNDDDDNISEDEYASEYIFNRNNPKSKKFHKILSKIPGDFQADLLIYDKKKKTEFDDENVKGIYILVIVDIYSRLAGARILTGGKTGTFPAYKSGENTLEAYIHIITNTFRINPWRLTTDNGKEFINSTFRDYLRDRGTTLRACKQDAWAFKDFHPMMGLVERLNRTIRYGIKKKLEHRNETKNINQKILDKVMSEYNELKHRGIGIKPREAWNGSADANIVVRAYNKETKKGKIKLFYKVGDKVRIMIQFKKGRIQKNIKRKFTYTKKVYRIVERINNTHRYKLSNGEILPYTRIMLTKADVSVVAAHQEERKDDDYPTKRDKKKDENKKRDKRDRGAKYNISDEVLINGSKIKWKKIYKDLDNEDYNTYIKTDYKMKVIEKAYSFKNGWKYKLKYINYPRDKPIWIKEKWKCIK